MKSLKRVAVIVGRLFIQFPYCVIALTIMEGLDGIISIWDDRRLIREWLSGKEDDENLY